MTTALIVIAVAVVLLAVAAVIAVAVTRTPRPAVTLVPTEDGYLIRGWGWRAQARLVIHQDMGRVYEVRWRDGVTYCPPTAVMLRNHAERERERRVGVSTER